MTLPPRPGRRFGRRGSEQRRRWSRVVIGLMMAGLAAGLGWGVALIAHHLLRPPPPVAEPDPPQAKPRPGECRPFTVTVDGDILHGRACFGTDGKWAVAPPEGDKTP